VDPTKTPNPPETPAQPTPAQPANGALVPIPPDPRQQQLDTLWSPLDYGIRTNLAPDDPDYEFLLLSLAGMADRKTRNAVGERLALVGFAIQPWDRAAEDGEVEARWRVCLLCDDGRTISSTAGGVIRSVGVLAKTRGRGRWQPAVPAEIVECPTESGQPCCVLRVLRSTPQPKPGRK
jgi:hypothetical protein